MLTVSGLSFARSARLSSRECRATSKSAVIREKDKFRYAHSCARAHDYVGVRFLHLGHARQSKSGSYAAHISPTLVQVVLSRNYRGDIEMNVIENFLQLLLEREDESRLAPIFQTADVNFVYIKHSDVYRNERVQCSMRSLAPFSS